MKTKKFRDPIYGYIEIEEPIVRDIIDTATFQRLRNIRQTSYGPLYPAALHNRFVHSLGVYHLGCLAFRSLARSLRENAGRAGLLEDLYELCSAQMERYERLFRLACLLHDVGHSPFSHTGEEFYEKSVSTAKIMSDEELEEYQRRIKAAPKAKRKECQDEFERRKEYSIFKHLAFLTGDKDLERDNGASPHEIMSCIVALEAFGQDAHYFKDDAERSFFARCITGAKYLAHFNQMEISERHRAYEGMKKEEWNETKVKMLQDCMIHLLHSSVIDVDRLDYIIRDAGTMGYQSVSIDYERLLDGLELVATTDYEFAVGFHKNAISVIENAVYAHDNEKKWVQTHPTILYDGFLVQQSIRHIQERMRADYPNAAATLLSYDSLTNEGSHFSGRGKPEFHIRYLCDADLIYLMKNQYRNDYSEEYFNRKVRRHPVWKSEAEFRYLFDESEQKTILNVLDKIARNHAIELNETTLNEIDSDIADSAEQPNMLQERRKKKFYVEKLLDVCERHSIKKSGIVILPSNFFKSAFAKGEVEKLPVLFSGIEQKRTLKDVTSTLSSEGSAVQRIYYFFYAPGPDRKKIDAQKFARDLLKAFRD